MTTDDLESTDFATAKGVDLFLEFLFTQWAPKLMAAQGEIHPMAIIFAKKNPKGERLDRVEPTFFQPVFDEFDVKTKNAVAIGIRAQARAQEAIGVIFISEVWTSSSANRENGKGALPADRLDRVESVMITIEHMAFPPAGRLFLIPILRPSKYARPTLGMPCEQKTGMDSGRFADLLERRATS